MPAHLMLQDLLDGNQAWRHVRGVRFRQGNRGEERENGGGGIDLERQRKKGRKEGKTPTGKQGGRG